MKTAESAAFVVALAGCICLMAFAGVSWHAWQRARGENV